MSPSNINNVNRHIQLSINNTNDVGLPNIYMPSVKVEPPLALPEPQSSKVEGAESHMFQRVPKSRKEDLELMPEQYFFLVCIVAASRAHISKHRKTHICFKNATNKLFLYSLLIESFALKQI